MFVKIFQQKKVDFKTGFVMQFIFLKAKKKVKYYLTKTENTNKAEVTEKSVDV